MNRIGIRRKPHILWDPTKLSGGYLYAWFDASRASTLTLVNSGGVNYVSSWKSVNNVLTVTQGTSTRRPYYKLSPFNKKMCIQFDHSSSDTTNDYLDGYDLGTFNATNAQLHMFAACRQTAVTIRAATGDTTENYMGIFVHEGYPGGIILADNSSGIQTGINVGWWSQDLSTQKSAHVLPSVSPYRQLTCFGGTIFGGISGTWWLSSYYRNYVRGQTTSTTGLARRQYPSVNVRIGCALAGGGSYAYPFQGELYELLLITGTITEQTKVKILEYLSAKWGP